MADLKSNITFSGPNPIQRFEQMIVHTGDDMRRAQDLAAKVLADRRLALMDETIYERGPRRNFTYNLRNSEVIARQDDSIVIGNTAEYAVKRVEGMTGESPRGYDLTSHYSNRAWAEKQDDIARSQEAAFKGGEPQSLF